MSKALGRPPLEAIRFFEAAGRHQSFAKAARELGVTSGAVSHRVRTLEQYLGVELFERQSHGLALSARGQAFLVEVQDTLSAFDNTAERFRALTDAKGGALKLVAVEAFAEMWLMPRLDAFRCAHPEIVIEFETSLGDHHEVDPAGRAFDVWIAFVASVPRTVQSEVLFEETLVPVCSPALLASRGRPEHPADLHGWPLLYDLAWDDYWAHWFAAREAGAPDMSRASGYRLYSMMVQAAVEGMGVALGHSLLIAPCLERGTLVELLGPPVAAPARYFLAVAPGSGEKPEARAFLDWLRAETRKSDAAGKEAVAPAAEGEG
jgi:LysR family glycine cleavage system transcriptional activator